ncbi:MAG: DUF493 family protein [Bacteroidales bacterium]|nr:DUF493 family protein [Bacteroidales bacterium]
MNFEGLQKKLDFNKSWPLNYMFKFIVPDIDGKVDKIVSMLPTYGKNSFKNSSNFKYVSITCVAWMNSAKDIIAVLEAVAVVDGVMIL